MTTGFPLLTIIVFLPVGGAALSSPCCPAGGRRAWPGRWGCLSALVELGFVVYLVVDFQVGQAGFQFVSQHSWIGSSASRGRSGWTGSRCSSWP